MVTQDFCNGQGWRLPDSSVDYALARPWTGYQGIMQPDGEFNFGPIIAQHMAGKLVFDARYMFQDGQLDFSRLKRLLREDFCSRVVLFARQWEAHYINHKGAVNYFDHMRRALGNLGNLQGWFPFTNAAKQRSSLYDVEVFDELRANFKRAQATDNSE